MDFSAIKEYLLSFVFTKRCRFCNNVCDIRDVVCKSCLHNTPTIDGDICFNCGCSKLTCNKKEKKHFYESICAPYYYDGAPKKAIVSLKYNDFCAITNGFAHDMVQCINKHYCGIDFDCCTFVPMHEDDLKSRGYNQAQLLAEQISKLLDIPCYELLTKDFKTSVQHNMPSVTRSGNLLGAIAYNQAENVNVENMRILLCDDVKTTGCTLDECAKVLLFEDCAEVRCITACIRGNK